MIFESHSKKVCFFGSPFGIGTFLLYYNINFRSVNFFSWLIRLKSKNFLNGQKNASIPHLFPSRPSAPSGERSFCTKKSFPKSRRESVPAIKNKRSADGLQPHHRTESAVDADSLLFTDLLFSHCMISIGKSQLLFKEGFFRKIFKSSFSYIKAGKLRRSPTFRRCRPCSNP